MRAITALSELHQRILRFERLWFLRAGEKVQAIRDTFAMMPVTYYRHLAEVLELPAAAWFDPPLVNRLRRLQIAGLRARRWRLT
jgi:hypothetical protein